MKTRSMLTLLVVVPVAAIGLAACGGSDDSEGSAAPATPATTAVAPADTGMDHGTTGAETSEAATAAVSIASPSADLRVTLDRLLGEHALLALLAAEKGLDGAEDFDAVAAALDENSVEVSEAIGSVYGDEAAAEFLDGKLKWRAHIGFFVDYVTALAKDDKAGQDEAVGNLMGYIEAQSAFLGDAIGIDRAAVKDALTAHVLQLKAAADAYKAGDYQTAYDAIRESYAHMFMTGDALAGGIVAQMPEQFSS